MEMKKIVGRDFLISQSKFIEQFMIHTDDSKSKFGGVIGQNGKLVDFYSHELTTSQINYTMTERELLSIMETPK